MGSPSGMAAVTQKVPMDNKDCRARPSYSTCAGLRGRAIASFGYVNSVAGTAVAMAHTGQEAGGVQYECQFRRHVNKCRQQWTENAEAGEDNADRINGNGAGKVLPDDAPRLPRDGHSLREAHETVAKQHYVGALARDVGAGTHGDADVRLGKRGSVID